MTSSDRVFHLDWYIKKNEKHWLKESFIYDIPNTNTNQRIPLLEMRFVPIKFLKIKLKITI
jgi:hypothetical protein